MEYLFWWSLFFIQSMSFTWVSRARNGGSIMYSAVASTCSNTLWFVTHAFVVTSIVHLAQEAAWLEFAFLAFVYVSSHVAGTVAMHSLSLQKLEKGHRQVGSRGKF